MSVETVARKYMELCSHGKHFEFMRTMYAADIVSVEGDGIETKGKEPVIHKSEVFQGGIIFHSQDLRGPFFCGDASVSNGKFSVYVVLEFTSKTDGKRMKHEEVGLYTVKNDMVSREEFYYEGKLL